MPGYAYTRSGAKQELLASAGGVSSSFAANVPGIVSGVGYYSWATATNLLLNAGQSSNLSTQNITTTAQAYTLSFLGTGTVTLSGTSVAGPLVGTGANNQVSLTFTPTAGTLTLTVTGNVTYSGLVAGSVTGPIIATAGVTATTGSDRLSATVLAAALTDQDMLFIVDNTIQANPGGFSFQIDNGTQAISILLFNAGTWRVWDPALQYNAGAAAEAVGVRHVRVLRRLSGNWRGGKVVGGVLTWAGVDTAGTMPAGLVNVRVGVDDSVISLNGSIAGVSIKNATYSSDAAVLAAVAATGF